MTSVSLLSFHTSNSLAAPGPYRLSAHGGSNDPTLVQGAKRASIPNAAGNCAHCHEQHASLESPAPANYMLFDTLAGNKICNSCHNSVGVNGAANIEAQFSVSKTFQHDPTSLSGLVQCNDCHDSHVAQKTNHTQVVSGPSNLVATGSPLLSVKGTSVSSWTAGAPAPGNEDLGSLNLNPVAEPITYEYELCFRCHAIQPPLAANLDVGLQFNPNNYSVHPVSTEPNNWKNTYLRDTNPAALNAPWATNVNAKMYCSDCHGSETTLDPEGPHGSTIKYMLKAGPGPTLFDNLCLKCHKDPALPGNSSWVDTYNTLLVGDHSLPAHQSTITNPGAGTNNTYGCLACHGYSGDNTRLSNVHGANFVGNPNNPDPLVDTGRPSKAFLVSQLITKNYFTTANGDNPGFRFCDATCHAGDGVTGYRY